MTDRELLELAAKAAALPNARINIGGSAVLYSYAPENGFAQWDPLTDDGDALRLAVKLSLEFCITGTSRGMEFTQELAVCNEHKEVIQVDPYAATRRAIVRAAAEIGRGMK